MYYVDHFSSGNITKSFVFFVCHVVFHGGNSLMPLIVDPLLFSKCLSLPCFWILMPNFYVLSISFPLV